MLSHYPTSLHEYCNFWFPEIFTDKEVIMFAALTNTDKDVCSLYWFCFERLHKFELSGFGLGQ